MKLLFIGDIVGRPGRELIRRGLKPLVRAYDIDVVLANGENAAGGAGVTRDVSDELFGAGIQVFGGPLEPRWDPLNQNGF